MGSSLHAFKALSNLPCRWVNARLGAASPCSTTPPQAYPSSAMAPLYRYPFLLVDRVLEWEYGKYAVGYKCVTVNDNFFPGHFPQRAIMPGAVGGRVMSSGCLWVWVSVRRW